VADRVRIAFVKFGGLAAGGTERWLQMMAANLPRDRFAVDYFYCDAAPYLGSDLKHPDSDPERLAYMREEGVNLVKFTVGAKDVRVPTHDWVDTDFWEHFDESRYDLVQTAKAGPPEYPYHRLSVPVVEYVTLSAGVDKGPSIALSIHLSQWQRRAWAGRGGRLERSDVIPIPAEPPVSTTDLRAELGIPADAVVAGFHQRAQDEIFSPIPLAAFGRVAAPDRWFVVMGGSDAYRRQAAEVGLERVAFVGHSGGAERISSFLNTLDVFAHGRADGETFGTVFAEAMMHRLPCLSHRSAVANAQPETMGPAGAFAEDVDGYAAELERLYADADLRALRGAKGREHAERYYTLQSCVDQLVAAYGRVIHGAGGAAERPPAYGRSDLGFLVAGDVDDPHSVAHHVVAGPIPDEPAADLLATLLPDDARYAEAGSAETLLPLVAARATAGPVHVAADGDATALHASVSLNGWEERVIVAAEPSPVAAVDWLTATTPAAADDAVRSVTAGGARPALLLRAADGGATASSLQAVGYTCRSVRRTSLGRPRGAGWLLALHPDRHAELLAATGDWRRHRRLGMVEAAARKARRGITRVGAAVYTVRQRAAARLRR
jgi:hypothetical protein